MTKPLLGLALFSLLVTGCDQLDNCPEGQKDITIDTGTTYAEQGIYVSSPWDSLDKFPAKTILKFKHDLGTTPEIVNTFIAFSEDGIAKGGDVMADDETPYFPEDAPLDESGQPVIRP